MSVAIKEIDLHGKTRYQAEIAIEAALRRSWGVYVIRLIHGYNSGTVLREFIRETYCTDPRVIRIGTRNPGITDLHLKELF